ncbi:hypothetical protein U9M48_034106 [Paspalum notatum var. saurae]|uniref:Uncharacterized protein n=1 Tax=Paspalum notatum var. saurae TaxID=547442 RepID=A0AAQ3X6U7_PASNO
MALALGPTPLAHLALAPPPISGSQASLLLLPRRPSPAPVSISRSLRSRVVAAVASKEPELGGSEGGDVAGGSGGGGGDSDLKEAVASKEPELAGGGSEGGDGAGGSGGGGSDPKEGNQEGEGEGEEEEMVQGLSMSQKLTLVYAALVGAGGVMGYMKSGSQKSLASGGISALILYFVHTLLPVRPVLASSIGLGISAALLTVMGSRFKKSGKIFPAGVVSLVSLVMVGGYFHGILRSSHA